MNEEYIEQCLDVSVRWNYLNIVKLLLSFNYFKDEDIYRCLKINMSQNMRKFLMSFQKKKLKSSKNCFLCC